MKHETSAALYAYWLSYHRGNGVRAKALQASELAEILPSLFLIDIENGKTAGFRFRFCGASIATRYGRDLSDENFLALWNATDAAMLRRDLSPAAFRATGMVTGMMAETVGGGFVSYEMLLLPLVAANGTAGAIGSMARVGGHDETNRVRARIVAQELRSIRFLPDIRPNLLHARLDATPGAVARSFTIPRKYGHLTVVPGGK